MAVSNQRSLRKVDARFDGVGFSIKSSMAINDTQDRRCR